MYAEQYVHLLIAQPADAVPTARQVRNFVSTISSLGVVPSPQEIVLRTVTGTREVPNPFTGGMVEIPTSSHQILLESEIEDNVAALANFELEVSGTGCPRMAPIRLESGTPEEYSVGIRIKVSSILRSTSVICRQDEETRDQAPRFGSPFDDQATSGYFSNLHNDTILEVPHAGSARFWIEVELGKFLFPSISENLDLISPNLLPLIEEIFDVKFLQGCRWI